MQEPITLEGIVERLSKHESHSQTRFTKLQEAIHELTQLQTGARQMEHGHGVHDKVEIHNTGSESGGGMGGLGGLAALAALGRNHDGVLGSGTGGFAGGVLGGGLGGLIAGALPALFGRRGWGEEGGRRESSEIERFIELNKLGDIQRDIATSANETQAVVNANGANGVQSTLQQTIALQQALAALAASTASGFCSTNALIQSGNNQLENTVQRGNFALSTEILNNRFADAENACSIKQTVTEDGEKTRALITRQYEDSLNRKLVEMNSKIVELENEGRFAEVRRQNDSISSRIEINNSAVAAQAQGQQQAQFQQLVASVNGMIPVLNGVLQVAHATNSNIIAGNTGLVATGPQSANPTNVNSR